MINPFLLHLTILHAGSKNDSIYLDGIILDEISSPSFDDVGIFE